MASSEEQLPAYDDVPPPEYIVRFVPFRDRNTVETILVSSYQETPSTRPCQFEAIKFNGGVVVIERVHPESPKIKRVLHVLIKDTFFHPYVIKIGMRGHNSRNVNLYEIGERHRSFRRYCLKFSNDFRKFLHENPECPLNESFHQYLEFVSSIRNYCIKDANDIRYTEYIISDI